MALIELAFQSGLSLSVRRFSVREQMSAPFEVYAVAMSPDEDLDLEAIVGKPAWLTLVGSMGTARSWTGVCSQAGQTQPEVKGLSTYEVVIVPPLWLLGQRRGHRIYQHKTIPEIVLELLGEWQIQPEVKLDMGAFPKQEYRVQYGESDFTFVERLLEEAGISYYFTDTPPGEPNKLVLADRPHANDPRPGLPIPFVDNPSELSAGECLTEVHLVHATRPGRTTLRDFDFRRRPDFPLFGEGEKALGLEAGLEQYHYMPGAFLIETGPAGGGETPVADDKSRARWDDKEGTSRAARRLESLRADRRRVTYEGNLLDLSPGVVFRIDHPHDSLSPVQGLLAVQMVLHGTHDGEWSLAGEAVFAADPYRPPLQTAKPRVEGLQSAIVVGPPGEEIYTDEFGRVRVRFHWDREGGFDDNRTCWIRVSQGWAGGMFGEQLIPRIGQEVLVDFFEGDPDQPIIVGRVFNATTVVPYRLPDHKTRSTWKSDSSPNSDGFNEILFEDKAGREFFYVQAQKDLSKLVKRNELERTLVHRSSVVGETHSARIGQDDSVEVGKKHTIVMVKTKDLKILQKGQPDVELLPTKIEMQDKKILLTTGDATILLDGPHIYIEAPETISFLAEGEVVIQGGPNVFLNCDCPPVPKGQGACLLAAARTGSAFVQKSP